MKREPYRQRLPALGLALERFTDAVPDDGGWYLLRDGRQIGRYRSLKAAKDAWAEVVAESGWQPAQRRADPSETIAREQAERWSRNRGG